MSANPESVLDILPGTHLKLEESAAVEEVVGTFIDQVYGERLTEDHLGNDQQRLSSCVRCSLR